MATFQTLQAWIGHNATRYKLPRVTTRYCQIYKKMYILMFFKQIDDNAWLRVANSPKPSKSQKKHTVTRVITRSSYGNALHYNLSMFAESEKLSHPHVISISARCHKPSTYFFGIH